MRISTTKGGVMPLTGVPTLRLLISLPIPGDGAKNNLNILQRTSARYTNLAKFLLNDDNCDIVDSLEIQYHHDPEEIVRAVYMRWISGTGRKPVTWQTLVDVLRLREMDLNILADEIETALNRRLYEEAMTNGYVETSVTKCLIIGAAGVGKTHLKHLLLKKDPPEQRTSTGLADNPRRAISFSLAGVGGQEKDDWFVVEDDQELLKVIGGFVTSGSMLKEISMDEVVRMLPKMPINDTPSDGAGADPTPAHFHDTMDTTQQEMIHHISHPSGKEKLFGVKWIHVIDSGGQLQYHDILPLFIQNPGVTVFVLNLSEELSHKPTIKYYGADGKPVGKAYRSSLSHKQILQHCLEAICSQNACPLIITVGTHRDAADKCSESIKDKNEYLKTLLNSDSFAVLYNGQALKEAIFAVNGKAPQDEDIRVAKVLREQIISMSPESIKMPIAWFGLEVLLKKSSPDGILSLVECQVCAKSLYIEGDAFSAALHYLVHHNVFLHYPEVLPQTVFCDPQVVLTKVTELVEYHHKLQHDPDKGVAARSDLVRFRDYGLLSEKLLRMFPKHFKEGLFTPHGLLQLLLRIGAIAKIRDSEYLMPALLSYLNSDQVVKYVHQSTPLIVKPTQGCIPSGLFCCLVAHLLSPTNPSPWKVCMIRDKPFCLHRNCITFRLKQKTEIVTLVDMFSYVVVHIDQISNRGVCSEVRESVHSGIKNACRVLKYQDVQFEDAFMCAGASCSSDPPHVATVVSENKQWVCGIQEHQNGYLSEGQLMWFGESVVTKQDPSTSVPVSLDSEPSLPLLMDKVAAVIPSEYKMVGLQLGLTQDELQAIRSQHQSVMFSFKSYTKVPKQGGRVYGGGGLVEVKGSVMWGGREGGVYVFNETNSKWNETAYGDEYGARLAVFGGRLARVGGYKNSVYSKGVMELRRRRRSLMPDMLIGCTGSCVLCVSGGGMVVMGGGVDEGRQLDDVQVFDRETQTWHRGPSLPQPCWAMSAVVHRDLVFVMGGHGMDRAVWCADIHDLTTTPTHDAQQSIWRRLPDVPHEYSSVCVVQGVLLALGGLDGLKKTSAIHAFHHYNQKWELVTHLPFACYLVDTLLLSGGGLLVVDGDSQQVWKITGRTA